jgi:hypothetical protein
MLSCPRMRWTGRAPRPPREHAGGATQRKEQWKTPRPRCAALLALGVSAPRATNTAASGYGPWRRAALRLDAVVAAAVLAFGFIYVHPFQDGNGRIHRYLIHHVLAQRGYNPAGVVFPVLAAILERINDYRIVLEDYSRRLLPLIRWEPAPDGNVNVLNDTADFTASLMPRRTRSFYMLA